MTLADPTDVVSAVVQLQFLSRTDALSVKTATQWLPSKLRSMTLPADVRDAQQSLKALLSIDLGKIGQGAELPPDAGEQLARFDRAVVCLRFSPDDWKRQLADKMLTPLLGELGPAPENPAAVFTHPTWLKFYRALFAAELVETEKLGAVCKCLDDAPEEHVENGLTLMTMLANECGAAQFQHAVDNLVRGASQHEECWSALFSERMLKLVRPLPPGDQRDAVHAWIVLQSDRKADYKERRRFLANVLRLGKPEVFSQCVCQLAKLVMSSGLTSEVEQVLAGDRVAELPQVLYCLSADGETPATGDAQLLIAGALKENRWASESVFREFSRRIRGLDLSFGMREELLTGLLTQPKLLRGVIRRSLDFDQLTAKARSSTADRQRQLFWLMLAAMQLFDGVPLRDASRGLSLIDLAQQQGKIDASHYQMLMTDLLKNTSDALHGLADGQRLEQLRRTDQRLALLYLTLRVLSEGDGKIDGVDLDNLSTTMRRLKSHDAGF